MTFHISGWFWRSSVLLRWNYEEVPVGWHSKLGHRVRWTLHARGLHRPVQVCQVDKWRYAWHRGDVSLNADVKARGDVADAKSDARGVKRAEKHWLPLTLTRGQFEAWWWPHDGASCRALSRGDEVQTKVCRRFKLKQSCYVFSFDRWPEVKSVAKVVNAAIFFTVYEKENSQPVVTGKI